MSGEVLVRDVIDPDAESAAAQTARRILETAERLFRHYGYSKTSVADIAREMGMSPANIYRFFSSKLAIHEALAERILMQREVILRDLMAAEGSVAEKLISYVVSIYEFTVQQLTGDAKVHEMVAVALAEHWGVIDRHVLRTEEAMARLITQGIERGEFPEQDPAQAARCFCEATVSACHPTMVEMNQTLSCKVVPRDLARFAVAALKASPFLK